ncbi:tRNA (adenosine(37)-N6)-dimethylallyltransferase MiaA [Pediococcus ethanolidurans]|uniref:tRNA (adenosine(37)-N6)-dimethylallyltransferase MiaA n=1 Tax=Pediococcus ethanolidurans TaxID=319653 RepID=UPI001C1F18BD|nr:tRNA (adenosine(37)-N6)-dimethylallyltransferase MiaA [Pediococcus ethanolidurans]MBU7554713.1 tRNA (adenosine(37)-N6)-dimethylallyltransferase MiaA [Pediococcus ethanolidurans]MBU7563901.1 tRNA (adenosine(37)-N6)-dimethylallyltransferase MiaA [Pediococcus ethanolidurans]MCT4397469.1 tRNA (adenosine(37)-N6)-dimethylallyltransferase MiaA [Pediococcus ethanolidurans]MCV3314347.1 tRNA (adenosine(37)-N6)-dimethylallyltransferase MiaA [Pediococcus ethanolidurans]MCV3320688.1 tRNA (adenosine(37)-
MEKVLAIVGPTAVGKTSLSLKLAKKFNGEIISGDSMQVYQNLNIGTAKISADEQQGIKHHLINIREIDQRFSVSDFKKEATEKIHQITSDGHLPIIVGGTGFYLQALLADLSLGNDQYEPAETVRSKWHSYAKEHSQEQLWQKLNDIDPKAAAKIPVTNEVRVVRALEVFEKTGQLFSEQNDVNKAPYDALLVGLNTDRSLLYKRIDQRVDQMVTDGLEKEAHWLYQQGGVQLPAGKGIGYREWYPYFKKQISKELVIAKIKQNSRHYAKRQLTWFRNKMNVNWFDIIQRPDEEKKIIAEIQKWVGGNQK